MKVDVDERDIFDISGPTHLSRPRWSDPSYKRAVIACLVQSVYVMEKDRQLGKTGIYALAPKWWIPFDYTPVQVLRDEHGEQVVGAVFGWNGTSTPSLVRPSGAPKVVVAFRGTVLQADTLQTDLTADLYLILHQLQLTPRFAAASAAVKRAVEKYGADKVTIAGHSLGAALCLMAGRILAEEGCNLDTHVFNPPFASPPLERIRNQSWQLGLHVLRMVAVAALATLLHDEKSRKEAYGAFLAVKDWFPHLYVNLKDPICSSYNGYFNSREYMLDVGGGSLAQLVAPYSLRGMLQESLFSTGESKPYHLIPSAHLHTIGKSSRKFRTAHGMQQWWSLGYQIQYRKVSFDIEAD